MQPLLTPVVGHWGTHCTNPGQHQLGTCRRGSPGMNSIHISRKDSLRKCYQKQRREPDQKDMTSRLFAQCQADTSPKGTPSKSCWPISRISRRGRHHKQPLWATVHDRMHKLYTTPVLVGLGTVRRGTGHMWHPYADIARQGTRRWYETAQRRGGLAASWATRTGQPCLGWSPDCLVNAASCNFSTQTDANEPGGAVAHCF